MMHYQIEELMGRLWIITEVGGMAAYDGKTYSTREEARAAMDRLVIQGKAEDIPLELTLEVG
jgi:hypothetical protein